MAVVFTGDIMQWQKPQTLSDDTHATAVRAGAADASEQRREVAAATQRITYNTSAVAITLSATTTTTTTDKQWKRQLVGARLRRGHQQRDSGARRRQW
jgi:hypothetical protein